MQSDNESAYNALNFVLVLHIKYRTERIIWFPSKSDRSPGWHDTHLLSGTDGAGFGHLPARYIFAGIRNAL